MAAKDRESAWNVTGLRTRYFPKNRIGQGLLSMAPWLNVVLLLLCFMLLNSRTTLQNGIVINLPVTSSFREGTGSELVATVISVPATGGGREENIFFDDVRFRVKNGKEMQELKDNLSTQQRERSDVSLVIQADREVTQGTIVKLMDMALDAGIKRVNIAAKSP